MIIGVNRARKPHFVVKVLQKIRNRTTQSRGCLAVGLLVRESSLARARLPSVNRRLRHLYVFVHVETVEEIDIHRIWRCLLWLI